MAASRQGSAWRLASGSQGGLCRRIHQQLEALWAANRGQKGDKADTAEALKAALDAEGEPWHVVIGPEGFVTNVRYRKESCFIFANEGAALRALVFQSSPLPEGDPAPAPDAAALGAARAEPPKNVSVYASEWEDAGQEAFFLSLLADSLADAGGDETAASVAIKAALTAWKGPLWHVLVAKDAVEMGAAVAAHAGTILDARVVVLTGGRGGAHRVVLWQHDLPLGLASALRLRLPRRAATLASVTCLAVALLLTLVTQAAPRLGLAALACDPPCCHPTAAPALPADGDGACAGVACTPEAVARAVGCVRVRGRLRWCALGFLLVAFVLKQLAAPKNAGKGRVGVGAAGGAGAARGQVAATRGRKSKGKRKKT